MKVERGFWIIIRNFGALLMLFNKLTAAVAMLLSG